MATLTTPAVAASLQLTVTGVDANGKLFREGATVLRLQGRNCTWRCKSEVLPETSLMVEIQAAEINEETWRAEAQVKGVTPVVSGGGLFDVRVEFERAYNEVQILSEREEISEAVDAALTPIPAPAINSNISSIEPTVAVAPVMQSKVAPGQKAPAKNSRNSAGSGAAADRHGKTNSKLPGLSPEAVAVLQSMIEEMVRNAVVAERKRETIELKSKLSSDGEKDVQGILEPRMASTLDEAIEKRMAQFTQTPPAVTDDMVQKLAARLAESPQLKASIARQDVSAKATAMERSVRETIEHLESGLNAQRAELQNTLELSRNAIKESAAASSQAEETLRHIGEAIEAVMPKMDASLRASMEARSAEFNGQIDHVILDRATRFISEIELLLAPRMENVGKVTQQLEAQLQSSEEHLRKQQDRFRETLRTAGEQIEKEIKLVLRRLSGAS